MTQEEKQLLLVDISARLTHKVRIKCDGYPNGIVATGIVGDQIFHTPYFIGGKIIIDKHTIDTVRPYLRPMSSMTEEEKNNYHKAFDTDLEKVAENIKNRIVDGTFGPDNLATPKYYHIDWLNSHHFDYRGLIEKGLALEAPEGMYES